MPYIRKIDNIIVNALYKHHKINFTKMLEIVKKQHPKITSRVLNRHLEDMKYINIIHRDPFRPGVDRNIWLTKNTS
jgi:DNA-binding HxlR family transcriptional regulator